MLEGPVVAQLLPSSHVAVRCGCEHSCADAAHMCCVLWCMCCWQRLLRVHCGRHTHFCSGSAASQLCYTLAPLIAASLLLCLTKMLFAVPISDAALVPGSIQRPVHLQRPAHQLGTLGRVLARW